MGQNTKTTAPYHYLQPREYYNDLLQYKTNSGDYLEDNWLYAQWYSETCSDLFDSMQKYGIVYPKRNEAESQYIYIVLSNKPKWAQVLYVGTGKGDRYKHANSGASHNRVLNKMHFEGVEMDTYIFADGLSKPDAHILEMMMIAFFNPIANSKGTSGYMRGTEYGSPYRALMAAESDASTAFSKAHNKWAEMSRSGAPDLPDYRTYVKSPPSKAQGDWERTLSTLKF